jgi:hypothetical protein
VWSGGLLAQFELYPRWVISSDLSIGGSGHTNIHFNAYIQKRPFLEQEIYYQKGYLNSSTFIETNIFGDYAFTDSFHGHLGINYLNILWGNGKAYAVGPSLIVQDVAKNRFSQWTIQTGVGYSLDTPQAKPNYDLSSWKNSIAAVNNQVFLSLGLLDAFYAETDSITYPQLNGKYFDTEAIKDSTITIGAAKTWNKLYTLLSLSAAKGRAYYTGSKIDGLRVIGESNDITPNQILDTEGQLGYQFNIHSKAVLTPFGVLAYHHWLREIPPVTASYGFLVNGSHETYQHYNYGVGLLGQWHIVPSLVLGLKGSIGKVVAPKMTLWGALATSNGERTISYYSSFKMISEPVYNFTLSADYYLGKKWHFLAHYTNNFFSYGRSLDNVFKSHEPESFTRAQEGSIGIGYDFS